MLFEEVFFKFCGCRPCTLLFFFYPILHYFDIFQVQNLDPFVCLHHCDNVLLPPFLASFLFPIFFSVQSFETLTFPTCATVIPIFFKVLLTIKICVINVPLRINLQIQKNKMHIKQKKS